MTSRNNDISFVLSGEAGQGLKTLEVIFSKIVKASGYHVFTYTEFMSRIRGGNNTTLIRVSTEPCSAFVDRIDFAIPVQENGLARLKRRITSETRIIGEITTIDAEYVTGGYLVNLIPLSTLARETGGAIFLNMVVCGVCTALMGIDCAKGVEIVSGSLKKGDAEKLLKNIQAFTKGYDEGLKIEGVKKLAAGKGAIAALQNDHLLYGSDSIGIGALAGGCNFIASYPMSPSTSVLEFLAKQSAPFAVAVEQAEDEIAAINMAIGSWYAGGRAMVSTSGGGFALMEEGVSLAAAMESPVVIHLAQRPGPATGLPTRTEQADLNLALYAGHGEFPRVIYAPADYSDGITLTAQAFSIADNYQIPVFVLTDQYFLDSSMTAEGLTIDSCIPEKALVKTADDYKRYALTPSGISPRGIPGYGTGIVCADSDEHDETGYITEDCDVRIAMVDKRNKKLAALTALAVEPRLIGPKGYHHLVVGWGSTLFALTEALERSGRTDVALLHFSQVFPIASSAAVLLASAKTRTIVENNATSQFGSLLTEVTGQTFDKKILKYNGTPFSVEELTREIETL